MNFSKFETVLPLLIEYFERQVNNFEAGQVSKHMPDWQKLTSDTEILTLVSGLPIEFTSDKPLQICSMSHPLSKSESVILQMEINKLLDKKVLVPSKYEQGEILSPVFLRGKPDGSHRLILNLKKPNEHIEKLHFKMETIYTVLSMITPSCFMASVDLKDAYYSIKIKEEHQKFLKFKFKDKFYKFTALPNGLSTGPRKFTKLLKPPLAFLRKEGHISCAYIDDLLNIGDSYNDCLSNVIDTVLIFDTLGFVIHPKKSHLIPTQTIVFLGFVIDSVSMTIRLTGEKREKIVKNCKLLLQQAKPQIRAVARVIGMLTASFPAVKYGPLHFRGLEGCKSHAVKMHLGNYNAHMTMNNASVHDLEWWISNIPSAYNDIYKGLPSKTLITDASNSGWGAVFGELKTEGLWNTEEQALHINALEMKAILFGLKSLVHYHDFHLQILSDNTTAVHIVNKMGSSHSETCNSIAYDIWEFAISKNIWISASHIPGKLNVEADEESRKHETQTEWQLCRQAFDKAIQFFNVTPNIDLFASRLNYQIKPFVSYRPDPEAFCINAFQMDWSPFFFYAFPPFSIMGKVLQKVIMDEAEGIIIVPDWPNQPWYGRLSRLLVSKPLLLPRSKKLLTLPSQPGIHHPLRKQLDLLACHISGKSSLKHLGCHRKPSE